MKEDLRGLSQSLTSTLLQIGGVAAAGIAAIAAILSSGILNNVEQR